MKYGFIILFTIFSSSILFSEYAYSPEYFPIINTEVITSRNFPSIEKSKILYTLKKNQKVIIYYKTIEVDFIDGVESCWYFIKAFDGDESKRGWVFGKYITFQSERGEQYWNATAFSIRNISKKSLYRNIFSQGIIKSLFGDPENRVYSFDLISDYHQKSQKNGGIWYMVKSGYTEINTYLFDLGELTISYNRSKGLWGLIKIDIYKPVKNEMNIIGMTLQEIKYLFGNDYTKKGNKIEYSFLDDFDSNYLSITFNKNKVEFFTIQEYWD